MVLGFFDNNLKISDKKLMNEICKRSNCGKKEAISFIETLESQNIIIKSNRVNKFVTFVLTQQFDRLTEIIQKKTYTTYSKNKNDDRIIDIFGKKSDIYIPLLLYAVRLGYNFTLSADGSKETKIKFTSKCFNFQVIQLYITL